MLEDWPSLLVQAVASGRRSPKPWDARARMSSSPPALPEVWKRSRNESMQPGAAPTSRRLNGPRGIAAADVQARWGNAGKGGIVRVARRTGWARGERQGGKTQR